MHRTHLLSLSAAVALTLGFASTSFADLFYVGDAGSGGGTTANAAGGGTWDNVTANWATTNTGAASTNWAAGGNAQFVGTAGGTVNTGDNLSVANLTFAAGAGSFTIQNTWDMEVSGVVANNSGVTQTISKNGTINFNGTANASGGSSAVTYVGDGFINFNGSSSAGNANITNNGILTFNGSSTGGTATIMNNSALDISALTTAGLTSGSLINNGSVNLGTGAGGKGKTLGLTSLTLDGGSEFDFTLGTTSALVTTASVTDNASPSNKVTIDVDKGVGFGALEYVLINDTGGLVNLADYALGTAPSGYILGTDNGGHELVLLSSVPEVSSFALPLAGAAALYVWMRRRRSADGMPAAI